MDLEHTFTVPIGIDEAWAAFTDLEGIAPCFPGAVITSVDGDDFTGTAKVKLGPIALMYAGKGRWVSRDDAAYRAVIEATGKDKRGNGTASATITAHLESQGQSSTTVVVATDLKITGRPAQFGRGVIQDVGGKILDQFATCLSARLGQDGAGGSADDTVEASSVEASMDGPGEPPPDEVVVAVPVADPVVAPPTSSTPATPPGPTAPAPPPAPSTPPVAAELDLGNVVGPLLLKRFGPAVAGSLAVVVALWLLTRRRR